MNNRVLTGVSALAMMATILAPTASLAHEKGGEHQLGAPFAIDGNGDHNGLTKFDKHSRNWHLKTIEGVVTAITGPVVDPKADGSLTIRKRNGKIVTFSFDSTSDTKYTTFLRKFKATATWNEVMVGDAVKVLTTKQDRGKAIIVWDKGIWWSEIRGTISAIDAIVQSFTLTKTIDGIDFTTTVKTDSTTTYRQNDTDKAFTDLALDQTVKIRGTWDSVGHFLLAKKITIQS